MGGTLSVADEGSTLIDHGATSGLILEQLPNGRGEILPAATANASCRFEVAGDHLEMPGVRADDRRSAEGHRFDHVASSEVDEGASDDHQVGKAVRGAKLADGVEQEPSGAGSSIPPASPGAACEIMSGIIEPFRLSRGAEKLDIGGDGIAEQLVLAGRGTARDHQRPVAIDAQGRCELVRPRNLVRDPGGVPLHAADGGDPFRGDAHASEAFCVGLILSRDRGERSKETPRDGAEPSVPGITAFAETAIDHRDRNPAAATFAEEVRPDLEFDQADRVGPDPVEKSANRPAGVERKSHHLATPTEQRGRAIESRVGHGRDHRFDLRRTLTQIIHQQIRRVDLPHRHRVEQDSRRLGRGKGLATAESAGPVGSMFAGANHPRNPDRTRGDGGGGVGGIEGAWHGSVRIPDTKISQQADHEIGGVDAVGDVRDASVRGHVDELGNGVGGVVWRDGGSELRRHEIFQHARARGLPEIGFDRRSTTLVHAHPDQGGHGFQFRLVRLDDRANPSTRSAPGRPHLDQHRTAGMVRQVDPVSREILERDGEHAARRGPGRRFTSRTADLHEGGGRGQGEEHGLQRGHQRLRTVEFNPPRIVGLSRAYPPTAMSMRKALNPDLLPPWHIRIDTGGTFTDAIALIPGGGIRRRKVLSSGRLRGRVEGGRISMRGEDDPAILLAGAVVRRLGDPRICGILSATGTLRPIVGGDAREYSMPVDGTLVELDPGLDAPRLAVHLLTRTPLGTSLPTVDLRIATTRATNALLTRRTGRVLLVTTAGFEDLAMIGDQSRPDLFALNVSPPRLTPDAVVAIDRHLEASGDARPIDVGEVVARIAAAVEAERIEAIAICLLHSWRDPEPEADLASAVRRRLPGIRVSVGSEVSPEIHLVPRVRTTIADAALSPVVRSFLEDLGVGRSSGRPEDRVLAMTSSGGLVDVDSVRPAETLLSGPAAGVVGAINAAAAIGARSVVGFDMGGTSTDVARAEGRADLRDLTMVGEAVVRIPSVDLHTVAAGGGSICRVVEGRLEVGPDSAGADPGPACYGIGGPLTITDVNLLLDRADPATFGVPIDRGAARRALDLVVADSGRSAESLLRGFVDLANERMAEAIRTITTRRGVDPADHVLVAFGGAGGQHACGIASRLGIERILIPGDAGLLSAVGLDAAARERVVERSLLQRLDQADPVAILAAVEGVALARAREIGVEAPTIRRRQWRCRLLGQDSTIDLDFDEGTTAGDAMEIEQRFRSAFTIRYGRPCPPRPVELAAIRVFGGDPPLGAIKTSSRHGDEFEGPALRSADTSTTVVDPGWIAAPLPDGGHLLRRDPQAAAVEMVDGPAMTEIVACRLESIARDMGETLRRTALSVNVKERLDYSCGIVDADGRLVVNAPHMPVHLGAMGDCVRSVVSEIDVKPGDTILVNHPAFGGSHLPDLTLVTPVFDPGGRLIAYVVNRAHHAEIGGTRPGSMPPDATTLVEEGVVFPPMLLVDGGEVRFDAVEARLRDAVHPSRSVGENLADLAAQLAANRLGERRISALHAAIGDRRFRTDLDDLRARCGAAIARLARRLQGVDRSVEERLDDGTPIRVRLRGVDGRLSIDFRGSGEVHPGNLNAPFAVVRAAVLSVLRVVAAEPIPLNEGGLEHVDLQAEPGILDPPFGGDPDRDPAVAIGNTETSQRVVDALFRAFAAAACSQGTMNNLLLGDEGFGYYETICGGSGAGPDFVGCDAVHTHMTNTRITDPEVLESRYPIRLRRFTIRVGSGGSGRRRGGHGVIRELEATRPLRGSLLAQHRIERPYGLEGGGAGAVGLARIVRADSKVEPLAGIAAFELEAGDRLVIETPGGGGHGNETEGEPDLKRQGRTGTG